VEKPRKTRVAVIVGGGSAAQAIGSVGAGDVLDGLDQEAFEMVPLGLTRDGRWVLEPAGEVTDARTGLRGLAVADVVFPVLRGGVGDNGTVQGLLEMAGLPYVGSGVFATAATNDREFCRAFARADGLPVVPHVVLRPGQELTDGERASLGLPVAVRPGHVAAGEGTVVTDWARLDDAVAEARSRGAKVVVETVLDARTIDVGVLAGDDPGDARASVPAEGPTVPADLPHDVARRAGELAVRAFAALECSGAARVTFRLTTGGELLLDGIDPMPELSAGGVLARMWAAEGLSYQDLVSSLINAALRAGTNLH
jgi:D-alanine-D-alanine ligase